MNVEQLIEALRKFPANAQIKCGISIPALYINTIANMSISGDQVDPSQCQYVRIVTAAPEVRPPEPVEE